MKHFALALIVIAILAADFLAVTLELPIRHQKSWSWVATITLIYAGVFFFHEKR